jgi:hypothetical protein
MSHPPSQPRHAGEPAIGVFGLAAQAGRDFRVGQDQEALGGGPRTGAGPARPTTTLVRRNLATFEAKLGA